MDDKERLFNYSQQYLSPHSLDGIIGYCTLKNMMPTEWMSEAIEEHSGRPQVVSGMSAEEFITSAVDLKLGMDMAELTNELARIDRGRRERRDDNTQRTFIPFRP